MDSVSHVGAGFEESEPLGLFPAPSLGNGPGSGLTEQEAEGSSPRRTPQPSSPGSGRAHPGPSLAGPGPSHVTSLLVPRSVGMVTVLLPAARGRNTGVRARAASESPHPEPALHASEPPHRCHLSLPTLPAATACTSAASSPFPAPLQTVQSVHIPPGGGDQGCS